MFQKEKGLTLLKVENPSELNFFYFRIATYHFFFHIASVALWIRHRPPEMGIVGSSLIRDNEFKEIV